MKKGIQKLALVAMVGSIAALAGCNSNDNMMKRNSKPMMQKEDQDMQNMQKGDRSMRGQQGQMDDSMMQDDMQGRSSQDTYRYRNQ